MLFLLSCLLRQIKVHLLSFKALEERLLSHNHYLLGIYHNLFKKWDKNNAYKFPNLT